MAFSVQCCLLLWMLQAQPIAYAAHWWPSLWKLNHISQSFYTRLFSTFRFLWWPSVEFVTLWYTDACHNTMFDQSTDTCQQHDVRSVHWCMSHHDLRPTRAVRLACFSGLVFLHRSYWLFVYAFCVHFSSQAGISLSVVLWFSLPGCQVLDAIQLAGRVDKWLHSGRRHGEPWHHGNHAAMQCDVFDLLENASCLSVFWPTHHRPSSFGLCKEPCRLLFLDSIFESWNQALSTGQKKFSFSNLGEVESKFVDAVR